MDSISRGCLLTYLKANPHMTYRDIIEFIEGMQPMEADGPHPTLTRQGEGELLKALTSLASGNLSLWPGSMG